MIKTFENCSPEYQITIVCFFIFLTLLCMILVIYEGTGKRQRKMCIRDRNLLSAIEFTGTKKAPSMGAGNKENYKQYLL